MSLVRVVDDVVVYRNPFGSPALALTATNDVVMVFYCAEQMGYGMSVARGSRCSRRGGAPRRRHPSGGW